MTNSKKIDNELKEVNLKVSPYGFSAMKVNDLGATEYTLVVIAQDTSGSIDGFEKEMEKCLKEIINACRKSPRADNLLIRLLKFSNNLQEVHGFKTLENCNEVDYDGVINPNGSTALCDATVNSAESLNAYAKELSDNDYDVNGIFIVITDGCENHSTNTVQEAKKMLEKIKADEHLESVVSILIGVNVNCPEVSKVLDEFKDKVGFTQYIELKDASAKTLARLAKFVSSSISSQSQSLGTGGPSKPLTF